jgi:hypothetical protein
VPTLPNEKAKDDSLKRHIAALSADGMTWLVLDEKKSRLTSSKTFKPIPEVATETADANEAEGEDLTEALSDHLECMAPFSTIGKCERSGS